jgi:hypothetical protein
VIILAYHKKYVIIIYNYGTLMMPYEIYFVPHNPEASIHFVPLLPGQQMGTLSYDPENVHAVAVTCDDNDSEAAIYSRILGNRFSDHEIEVPEILSKNNKQARATPDKKGKLAVCDEKNTGITMIVRYAGKSALRPNLN